MLTFNAKYFFLALLLFIIEILIAVFVHDGFIRPYFGDFLVVMLIYCALRTFIKATPLQVAIFTLLFACTIEVLQYFNFVERIGLSNNVIARTVIGYGFDWWDIVAYTLGVITILVIDQKKS